MDQFCSNLKRKYQKRLMNHEKQWPPCRSNELIRLDVVEREKDVGCFASIQRDRQDDVRRTPIAYADLFNVDCEKKPVRRVLVEGDAGIGKTSFCTAASEDWAEGKLFQQFALVLFLPLRIKEVAAADSLPMLLRVLHSNLSLCHTVAQFIEEEDRGESVLIIIDGWDELNESVQNESFLYCLLFQQYPSMSVIVTSRPLASAQLHKLPHIDRFVEVCGFSKEHIIEYIQSEFASDQERVGHLLEQLEYNPLIESVCSIPYELCHCLLLMAHTSRSPSQNHDRGLHYDHS